MSGDPWISLVLPWPPSVNPSTAHTAKARIAAARRKRDYAWAVLSVASPATRQRRFEAGDLIRVSLSMYPPDGRGRDPDNVLKALFDALVTSRVIPGDTGNTIRSCTWYWREPAKPGRVAVDLFHHATGVTP